MDQCHRNAAGHRCRPRLCRGRACGAGRSAVPDSGPICGRAVCGLPVRGGRRHYRGAHQSHRGGAAQRRQGRLDEPAARILLLGPCGGGGAVNPVFRVGGHRTLGAAACAVGRAAAVQHGAVRAGAAVQAGGRRAPHATARTAEKQNDLAVPFDDGMCGRPSRGCPSGLPCLPKRA